MYFFLVVRMKSCLFYVLSQESWTQRFLSEPKLVLPWLKTRTVLVSLFLCALSRQIPSVEFESKPNWLFRFGCLICLFSLVSSCNQVSAEPKSKPADIWGACRAERYHLLVTNTVIGGVKSSFLYFSRGCVICTAP